MLPLSDLLDRYRHQFRLQRFERNLLSSIEEGADVGLVVIYGALAERLACHEPTGHGRNP